MTDPAAPIDFDALTREQLLEIVQMQAKTLFAVLHYTGRFMNELSGLGAQHFRAIEDAGSQSDAELVRIVGQPLATRQ